MTYRWLRQRAAARLCLSLIAVLGLTACAVEAPLVTPSATPTLRPMPSETLRPTSDATVGPAATPVIIASPTATATPVTHQVQGGETLLSIAIDYGVSVEALQAANPIVQVRFLSIGTVLLIPPPEGEAAVSATQLAPPPAAEVALGQPACYLSGGHALVCLIEARNPGALPLENISAGVTLAASDGLPFASGVAFSALDLLLPGQTGPLSVVFRPAPAQAIAASAVTILTANTADAPAPGRALPLDILNELPVTDEHGVTVAGQVRGPEAIRLNSAWVVLTIFADDGALLGYRRLEIGALAEGEARAFSVSAGSLGGAPAHYLIAAEGRP